jgi:hypothetical protein
MESAENSFEALLIGGIDREEHTAKLVVERAFEVRRAPQQIVGRIPLLAQEQLVELGNCSREIRPFREQQDVEGRVLEGRDEPGNLKVCVSIGIQVSASR